MVAKAKYFVRVESLILLQLHKFNDLAPTCQVLWNATEHTLNSCNECSDDLELYIYYKEQGDSENELWRTAVGETNTSMECLCKASSRNNYCILLQHYSLQAIIPFHPAADPPEDTC